MPNFKKGDIVRQIVPVITGEVVGFDIDQESGDKLILVAWMAEDDVQSRYFKESDLELKLTDEQAPAGDAPLDPPVEPALEAPASITQFAAAELADAQAAETTAPAEQKTDPSVADPIPAAPEESAQASAAE